MEERKKNLCAMIPESLHKKVREEQEEWGIKLNEYMERILKDHFEKGEREMANGTRTLAFQVSEVKKIPQKDRTEPERICDRTD